MNDLIRLNSADDNETWFYGARDRGERTEITDQIVSSKVQVNSFSQNSSINCCERTKSIKSLTFIFWIFFNKFCYSSCKVLFLNDIIEKKEFESFKPIHVMVLNCNYAISGEAKAKTKPFRRFIRLFCDL